ncbi:unannotated protein [freshwater metagenome]|uniref:Unannotated protein n=1 Tax=freshwater metagenome TaxID=449393 RepID=A0A6J6ICF8_9ZZZZ
MRDPDASVSESLATITTCSAIPAPSPLAIPVAEPAAQYQVELAEPGFEAVGTVSVNRTEPAAVSADVFRS